MTIRPAEERDRGAWLGMRRRLWPAAAGEHEREIERYFLQEGGSPLGVLLAIDEGESVVGFVELSIRAYAEGCRTDRVAFVEGWYVEPDARGRGLGRALISAAEAWGRTQGCLELGSDVEVDNRASAEAHRALGFEETGVIRCFLKPIPSESER